MFFLTEKSTNWGTPHLGRVKSFSCHFCNWAFLVFMDVANPFMMTNYAFKRSALTPWGRVTHICVGNLIIIGSNNGLSPGRREAIIWTNAGILLMLTLGTNFSEILIEIQTFSFKKLRLKVSSAKWRPLCLGLNVLNISVLHPIDILWYSCQDVTCHDILRERELCTRKRHWCGWSLNLYDRKRVHEWHSYISSIWITW